MSDQAGRGTVYEDLKDRSREVWSTGDYEPTSRQLEPVSAALVEALAITTGHRILDVAAGHGNCALAAARRGASVVASDFSPVMIETGRARTQAHDLDITWQEADAADLPFDDDSFDRVTSVFGAIFAPEHQRVAAECVRVVRPGGAVGLTAWTPDGLTGRVLEAMREFAPPPAGEVPDPFRWGRPDEVLELFSGLPCEVRTRRRTATFRYPSWEDWQHGTSAHGMSVVTRRTMAPDRYEAMRRTVREITAEHDHGEGGSVAFDSDYLEITVTTS